MTMADPLSALLMVMLLSLLSYLMAVFFLCIVDYMRLCSLNAREFVFTIFEKVSMQWLDVYIRGGGQLKWEMGYGVENGRQCDGRKIDAIWWEMEEGVEYGRQ